MRRVRRVWGGTKEDIPVMPDASDPNLIWPAEIKKTIARGKAAFKKQSRRSRSPDLPPPSIVTSVIDQKVQDHRDSMLDEGASRSTGKRQQPPMTDRLRAVLILVDRLISDGVPFGVGRNSKMNQRVQEWLNARAERSTDTRKSRRKPITQDAVREILRQVKPLLPPRG